MQPSAMDVAAIPLPCGGFGAVQVSSVTSDLVTAYALDWVSEDPPILDDLIARPALKEDHYSHTGDLAIVNIDPADPLPPGMIWLGQQPIRDRVPAQSNAFSGWESLAISIRAHRRWHQAIPAPARAAYKRAPRNQIEVDFGCATKAVHGWTG